MKMLFRTGAFFAALIAGHAVAADLAAPVYAVPAVPVDWGGFYIGVEGFLLLFP